MKSTLTWEGGMKLKADSDGSIALMDAKAPLGKGEGQTPKELVLSGLGGCTGMDVIALLNKHKQKFSSFEVVVDAESTTHGHPVTFAFANITFHVSGEVDSKILLESVHMSQTKFCGVSAMLSKALPIKYKVILNGNEVGSGEAHYE